jgi:ectoine hydroxylase-related dioxygenase (phytanoyl-CoA dioxygenase family)
MTLSLTQAQALNAKSIASYEIEGFLIEREVFGQAEIARVQDQADALLARTDLIDQKNLRCRWQKNVTTGECVFDTFDPVIDLSPAFAALASDRRILGRLACLYGEEPALFKDKLIYKLAGATGFDLHQDYISWPSFPRTFITVVVPLDATTLENGCTVVYARHHRQGYLSPLDGNYHALPPDSLDESDAVPLLLEPGDIAIFGCMMPHCSAPNRSAQPRRQLYFSYNALSDGGRQREQHYSEFKTWLTARYAEYGKLDVDFR